MHPFPKNPEKCPVAKVHINLNSLQSLFNGDKTDEETPAAEKNLQDLNLLSQVSLVDHSKEVVQKLLSDIQIQLPVASEDRLKSETNAELAPDSSKNKRSLSRQATKTIQNSNEALQSVPSQRTRPDGGPQSRKQSRLGKSFDASAGGPQPQKPTEPSSVAKLSNTSRAGLQPSAIQASGRKPVRSVSVHAVHEMASLVRDVDRLATNLQHRLFLQPKSVFQEYQQQAKKKREEKQQIARRLLAQREAQTRSSSNDPAGTARTAAAGLETSPRSTKSKSRDASNPITKRVSGRNAVPRTRTQTRPTQLPRL